MSLSAKLPQALMDTILGRLVRLLLAAANGNDDAARQAAARQSAIDTLADYNPETAAELRLAANIVSFSLHAVEALSQAADPDLSLTKVLRLRGSAVSLSREAHKAERRLLDLQQARRAGLPEPQQADIIPARAEKAIALVEATRQPVQNPPVWSKAYQQQQAARRITENLKKNAAAANAAATAHPRTDSSSRGTATGSASPAA